MNIDKTLQQIHVYWVSSFSLSLIDSLCFFSSVSVSLTEVAKLYLFMYHIF